VSATLAVTGNVSSTYGGTIDNGGSGNTTSLLKSGVGTLTLSGNNTFTGAVAVSNGVLNLANTAAGAAANTTAVSVASGATLLLSQSEQVKDTAGVTLSGGTIQRVGGVSEVFGTLNVITASVINFGSGAGGTITFSGLDYTPSALLSLQLFNFTQGNSLVINNTSDWGDPELPGSGFTFGGTGGFGSYSFSGGTFTITAIPEPSTYLATIGLALLLLVQARSHRLCLWPPWRRGDDSWGTLASKAKMDFMLLIAKNRQCHPSHTPLHEKSNTP
jgi:autotransporter-associated beta strand protein